MGTSPYFRGFTSTLTLLETNSSRVHLKRDMNLCGTIGVTCAIIHPQTTPDQEYLSPTGSLEIVDTHLLSVLLIRIRFREPIWDQLLSLLYT